MEIADPVANIVRHKETGLWLIAPDETVHKAIKLMDEKNVGALPVVAAGDLVGIVSERDYTRKVFLRGKSSSTTLVREIMTPDVVCATLGDSVERCMQLMTQERIRHLPIFDNNKLEDIVSIGDLVKWTISAQGAMIDHLEKYINGAYPV